MFNRLVLRYSFLAVPIASLGLPFYIYAPTWLAEKAGGSGYGFTTVGIIILLARLTDIFTDIPVGIWSQPARRQKLSMWIGAGLIAVSAAVLLTAHPLNNFLLGLALVVVFLGWTMVTIPWMALPARLSSSAKQRFSLNSGREIILLIATFFALVIPNKLDMQGVQIASIVVIAGLALAIYLQPSAHSAEGELAPGTNEKTNRITSWQLLKNPEVRKLAAPWFLNTLANTLPGVVVIIFARDILGDVDLVGYALAIYFLASVCGAPLMYRLINRFGTRKMWMFSVAWIAAFYPLVSLLGAGDGHWFLIISIFTGVVLSTDSIVPTTIQTALAHEISAQEGGAEVNTRLFALWSLLTKAAMGIGAALGFIWLGANIDEAKPSVDSVVFVYVWIPVILKLCILPLLWRLRDFSTED